MKRLLAQDRAQRIYEFYDHEDCDEGESAVERTEMLGQERAGKAAHIIQERQSQI